MKGKDYQIFVLKNKIYEGTKRVQRYLIRVKNKVQFAHILEGAVERLDKDLWGGMEGRRATCGS